MPLTITSQYQEIQNGGELIPSHFMKHPPEQHPPLEELFLLEVNSSLLAFLSLFYRCPALSCNHSWFLQERSTKSKKWF